jgi:uncharacterized protein YcbX
MRLARLSRYPVKSLVGEDLERVLVEERGLVGDRLWSVRDRDGRLGSGKSTRRFRRMDGLLELAAHYDGETPVVTLPDGRALRGDDPRLREALSEQVGRPVSLAREHDVSHFDEGPLHLVTTASLDRVTESHGARVDPRRLRPNLVIETDEVGYVEQSWVGRRLTVGDQVVLAVRAPMPRCVMVTLPQRDLPADGGLLGTVADDSDLCLGVVVDVVTPGPVAVGDDVALA